MKLKQKFVNVYTDGRRIYTSTLFPESVYGESIVSFRGKKFRSWDPRRSKLGAAIVKGLSDLGIKENSKVLYLGSASGTTVSHVSDIVKNGFVFALDFAPRVMRDLVFLSEKRKNIIPLLFDAFHPEEYVGYLSEIDFLFQDVAQRNQVGIFLKNSAFLQKGSLAMLSVKSRSIDVSKRPKQVFSEVKEELSKHLKIVQSINLNPFEQDHIIFVCKK